MSAISLKRKHKNRIPASERWGQWGLASVKRSGINLSSCVIKKCLVEKVEILIEKQDIYWVIGFFHDSLHPTPEIIYNEMRKLCFLDFRNMI